MSCTPREPGSNLFGIHESVGLVPITMRSYSKEKKRKKIKKDSDRVKHQVKEAPRYSLINTQNLWHSEITAAGGENEEKHRKQFFLPIWLKLFIDFGDSPHGTLKTKSEGKIHVLCTVRSDMPSLMYLPRWLFLLHMQDTHFKQKRKMQKEKPSKHRCKKKTEIVCCIIKSLGAFLIFLQPTKARKIMPITPQNNATQTK